MKQLVYELRQVCFHNRDGSFTTQYQRTGDAHADGLSAHRTGLRQLHAQDITRRHANKLVAYWKEQGISDDSIRESPRGAPVVV